MKKILVKMAMVIILSCALACALAQIQPDDSLPQPNTQNKVSLDIKGMDIIDVLKMMSAKAGMNLIIGKNVTGRVTLFLKDVDVQDAFDIIVLANDLAYEKQGDISAFRPCPRT